MKAALYTLGCKVNQYETQIMEQRLRAAGYAIAPAGGPADVFVVNSCTVTAESDAKCRRLLHRIRRENPGALIVLTGCLPQAAPEAARAMPEADVIAGTTGRAGIVSLIEDAMETGGRAVRIGPHVPGEAFEPMRAEGFEHRTRAFVKIEDGCENFCSYCVIPYARGPVRSKPLAALREELASLAAEGYREAVLVGINLSAYGSDLSASSGAGARGETLPVSLADALRAADGAFGDGRIRLGSLSPILITGPFLEAVRGLGHLCPHFHLSLQSGCAGTLRRMNRRYTPDGYREAVERLREAFPGCAITTDVIAGFPGETEEEFEESLAFARSIRFAQAHIFVYSRRKGTRAAALPGQVPRAEKERRARLLHDSLAEDRRAFLRAHVGRTERVLFETTVKDGLREGFAADYAPVRVPDLPGLAGKLAEVLVTSADGLCCVGRVVSPAAPKDVLPQASV